MRRIIPLLLCCLLLTGCVSLPGEERSFALCLGVHATSSGVEVTVQLPNYKADQDYLTLSAVGDSFSSALTALTAVSPSRLHFGQLRLLIFSEETAKSALFPHLLGEIAAIPGLRLSVMVLLTKDEMPELLTALKPQSGIRLSKYLDTQLRAQMELGFLPGETLSDIRRMGNRRSPALGYVSLKKEGLSSAGLAGDAATLNAGSEGDVHFGGCGLIGRDGLLHGELSLQETQLLTMLLGRTKDLPLVRREAAATLHVRTLNFRGPTDAAELRLTARAMVTQGTPAAIESLLEAELADLFARLAAADCAALSSIPTSIKVRLLPQG